MAVAATLGAVALIGLGPVGSGFLSGGSHPTKAPAVDSAQAARPVTSTPIKHVVVIIGENVSFDHYFGTYPNATNSSGQPFYPAPHTPSVNGLTGTLLTDNPNGANPQRLDPATVNDLLTCDQNHDYTPEQFAFNDGAMDRFTAAGGTATTTGTSPTGQACQASDVMNYYDGNSVTAMWNYAQHFALNDNSFGTTFGPSAPGAINLVSGSTGGVDTAHAVRGALTDGDTVADGTGGQSLIGDAQPYWDDCSSRDTTALTGQNVGNLLNAEHLSWGWFEGGFTPNTPYTGFPDTASTYNQLDEPGRASCTTSHDVGVALGGTGQWGTKGDYIEHHEPFQYYASTANPHHLAPTSLAAVGTDTATPGKFNTANHQYDTTTFDSLVGAIKNGKLSPSHLPAVSFLKAPGYEDAHPAYSDPVDEQAFVVKEINSLESLSTWSSTAVILAYDDSDGWYDHVSSGVSNPSQTAADVLTGPGQCGTGTSYLFNQEGRCGYGPRLPLMVISPYAKANSVSDTLTDQSSIIKFIEDNWALGQIPGSAANIAGALDGMFQFAPGAAKTPPLDLSPSTGEPSFPVVGGIAPNHGSTAGGTQVTIKGLNFSTRAGATVVRFGNQAAPNVQCPSSTTCVAITPRSSVAARVQVTAVVNGIKSIDNSGAFAYQR
jgi:phospholipase C